MIYIDVDGVIANFEKWGLEKDPDIDGKWDDRLPSILSEYYEESFITLEETSYCNTFINLYRDNKSVKFLTALPENLFDKPFKREVARLNKIKWLTDRGISEDDIIIVDEPHDKILYCKQGNVLFDDNLSTIKKWRENQGVGILIKSKYREYEE